MNDPILRLYYLGIAVGGLGLLLMTGAAYAYTQQGESVLFSVLFWAAIGVGLSATFLRTYVKWREIEEKKYWLVIYVTDSE